MARFLFWSDLHCEFSPFDIPVPADLPDATPGAPTRSEIDAILLPGDIDVKGRHVDWMLMIWDLWRCPVLAVAGNHEPYGAKRFQHHLATERSRISEIRSAGADIDVLRASSRIIGDTRVLGATLWTDMRLYPHMHDLSRMQSRRIMNDYARIQWKDEARGIYRKMMPDDTIEMHRREFGWIMEELAKPFDGKTVVMTHHLPVMQMMNETRFSRQDPVDAAYASDLWPKIGNEKLDAWICGHSHSGREACLDGAHGRVAFLSNMRGYPGERTRFDPLRVLDSDAPLAGISLDTDVPEHRQPNPEAPSPS